MSLNHVLSWEIDHWVRIKPEKAQKDLNGHAVSSKAQAFCCELCGKYVTFVPANKTANGYHKPFFKHSRGDYDKECPEREIKNRAISYDASIFPIPLKLSLSDGSVSVLIGFFSSFAGDVNDDSGYVTVVPLKVSGKEERKTELPYQAKKYGLDRIQERDITYLPGGSGFEEGYRLSFTKKPEVLPSNPFDIPGFLPKHGYLFNGENGKLLPKDADVVVGKNYYVLLEECVTNLPDFRPNLIDWEEIFKKGMGKWRLFRICAKKYCEENARVFTLLHARLTARPVELAPIWPITTKDAYTILYGSPKIAFYALGDNIDVRLWPRENTLVSMCRGNPQLIELKPRGIRLLVSAGRTNALKYTFLSERRLTRFQALPPESVKPTFFTVDDVPITTDVLEKRLKHNRITVRCPFESAAELYLHDKLFRIIHVDADNPVSFEIPWHSRLDVYTGNDLVARLVYGPEITRPAHVTTHTKLENSFSHPIPFGAAKILASMPAGADRDNLKSCIASGRIDLRFYKRTFRDFVK